ncbi:MAG: hypothetical protein ACYDBB_24885 [Armatimonadota bacterium]
MTEQRSTLTKGERRLLLATGIFVAVILVVTFWWLDSNADPVVSFPPKVLPTPNAADFYQQASNAVVKEYTTRQGHIVSRYDLQKEMMRKAAPSATPNSTNGYTPTLADYQGLMQANAPAIRLLRKGFAYEYVDPTERTVTNPYAQHTQNRDLSRLLQEKAFIERQRQQWPAALETAIDTIQLGIHLPRGSGLVGRSVGSSSERYGRDLCWVITDQLNAKEAKMAVKRLEKFASRRVSYLETVQEQKYISQAEMLSILKRDNWRRFLASIYADNTAGAHAPVPLWKAKLLTYTCNKTQAMCKLSAYYDRLIVQAKAPYSSTAPPVMKPDDPINYLTLSESFALDRTHTVVNETEDSLLMTVLAIRAYHKEHGSYPPSLQALVPAYLSAVQTDPFAPGKPLQYRLNGQAYLLYSIGPDGKDNGGTPSADGLVAANGRGISKTLSAGSTGDIVAGVNLH